LSDKELTQVFRKYLRLGNFYADSGAAKGLASRSVLGCFAFTRVKGRGRPSY